MVSDAYGSGVPPSSYLEDDKDGRIYTRRAEKYQPDTLFALEDALVAKRSNTWSIFNEFSYPSVAEFQLSASFPFFPFLLDPVRQVSLQRTALWHLWWRGDVFHRRG